MNTWTGVVLNADDVEDRAGHRFLPSGVELLEQDVPVVMNGDHRPETMVGVATLKMEGTQVIATLKLFRDLPNAPLYPSVNGVIMKKEGPFVNGSYLIKQCRIRSITLSYEGNSDTRIKPFTLGENMETVTKQELDQMETEVTASLEFSRKTDAKMTVKKLEKDLSIIRLAKKGLESK